MTLRLDDADRVFRDELHDWLERNRDAFDDEHEWHRRLVAGRWAVPGWPDRWGGRDATPAQQMLYQLEMGAVGAPVPRNSIALFNIGPMLLALGTPQQQERYLPPMVAADEIWCQGFSEPSAGSDLAAIETTGRDAGDHWLLTGQKLWTTFGKEADLCLALVRTDPTSERHEGISALIVDMRHPGVTVRPLRDITGDESFNEIFFDDVPVPKHDVVGAVGGGWQVAMTTLTFERLGTVKLGVQLRHELDALVALAQRLGVTRDPLVRQRVAGLAVEVHLMELLAQRALDDVAAGRDPGAIIPLGKLQWSELMQHLAECALELQGQRAQLFRDDISVEGDWQYKTLYSRMTTIGAGTTQVQKNIVALRVLGLPRGPGATGKAGLPRDAEEPEERTQLRATVRRFLTERAPLSWVRALLDADRAAGISHRQRGGVDDDVWEEMAALGLHGLLVPEEHGGLGLGYLDGAVVLEELGAAVHPGPFVASSIDAVTLLRAAATEAHQARLLPAIADGSRVVTVAIWELGTSGWQRPATRAEQHGDGWRVHGDKAFVAYGPSADVLLVVADVDGDVGLFRVDAREEIGGQTYRQYRTIDETRRLSHVNFLPAPAIRIDDGDAATGIARAVDRMLATAVAEAVGTAERALRIANEYSKVRVQFGQPIGSFQAVQHLLADMVRRVELARAGARAALAAADAGDDAECHRAAIAAKAYAGDALARVTADAIQVLGGIGFTWEHDAHLFYKRTLALQHALGGTSAQLERYAQLLFDG